MLNKQRGKGAAILKIFSIALALVMFLIVLDVLRSLMLKISPEVGSQWPSTAAALMQISQTASVVFIFSIIAIVAIVWIGILKKATPV